MAEEEASVSLPRIFRESCRLHDELEAYQGSTSDEKFQVHFNSLSQENS